MNVATSDINHIYKLAIKSRISFLLLSLISNHLIFDHESDTFTTPSLAAIQFGTLDKFVWTLFGGLLRWDAQHFLHIASNGYTYENNLPFFPLFPMLIKNIAICFKYLIGLNIITSLLLSASLVNFILFMKACSTLYLLTLSTFKNQKFAYYTVLFFCSSPATIFFIAPYSETLFSFCVFKGMLKYVQYRYLSSLMWFSVSVLARANGIVNVGFVLHLFFYYMAVIKFKNVKTVLRYSLYSLISVGTIFFPFIAFQLYLYLHFCVAKHNHSPIIFDYAQKRHLVLAGGNRSEWCNSTIPFSYSYIQDHYWDVGFLRYYSIKQIPNFCLALPLVLIIFRYCGKYLFRNWRFFLNVDQIYKYEEVSVNQIDKSVFVFVVHVMYLTVFAVTNINVQVTTRLIASSSPLIYWIATQEFIRHSGNHEKQFDSSFFEWIIHFNKKASTSGNLIKGYFLLYAVLGTILFSNNYPWT